MWVVPIQDVILVMWVVPIQDGTLVMWVVPLQDGTLVMWVVLINVGRAHTRCNSCCVGRTHRHVNTRIEEHSAYNTSTIFKHINLNVGCKAMYNRDCFKIMDPASTQHKLNV